MGGGRGNLSGEIRAIPGSWCVVKHALRITAHTRPAAASTAQRARRRVAAARQNAKRDGATSASSDLRRFLLCLAYLSLVVVLLGSVLPFCFSGFWLLGLCSIYSHTFLLNLTSGYYAGIAAANTPTSQSNQTSKTPIKIPTNTKHSHEHMQKIFTFTGEHPASCVAACVTSPRLTRATRPTPLLSLSLSLSFSLLVSLFLFSAPRLVVSAPQFL